MKKYIILAALVALVLIGSLFIKGKVLAPLPYGETSTSTGVSLGDIVPPAISLTHISDTPITIEAWQTFEKYVGYAKAHDLKDLAALSYQLSPACQAALTNPANSGDCYSLMDSVVYLTQDFQEKDFIHIAYDSKQIVLSTDYLGEGTSTDRVKTVIYFIRATSSPKVLSIRFCFGMDTTPVCNNTDPSTRDSNHNGWWDDVEALFHATTTSQ